jgi:transcriptional regulator with XRE-family HTH domain
MIGDNVQKLRETRGYSITELAELAGVSPGYVGKLERGEIGNPGFMSIQKIAVALDVTLDALAGGFTVMVTCPTCDGQGKVPFRVRGDMGYVDLEG